MKLNYEVVCVAHGGKSSDMVYCKNKADCLKKAKELEKSGKYEAVIPQANNGEEIVDVF